MQIIQNYFPKVNNQQKIYTLQKAIQQLQAGDVFKGIVENITKDQILLKLLNGTSLTARLGADVELKIGQELPFKVLSSKDGQIVIKPELNSYQSKDGIAHEALKEAGIPLTKENMKMIFKLINHNLPIDKASIQTINRYVNQNQIPLNKVLFMLKQNLQVSDKNVELINRLVNHNEHLSSQIEGVIDEVVKLPIEQRQNLLKALLPNLTKDVSDIAEKPLIRTNSEISPSMEPITHNDKNLASLLENVQSKVNISYNDNELKTLSQAIHNNRITYEEVQKVIDEEISNPQTKEQINRLLAKELLVKDLFIQVDQGIQKDSLDDIYEKIYKAVKTLENNTSNISKSNEIQQKLVQVKEQLQILQQINQNITLLNIPLQMTNGLTQGNLMIFEEKDNGQENGKDSSKTALITLDTAFLGHFECYLSVNDSQVSCQIGVENENVKTLVENKMGQLSNQLQSIGYMINQYSVKQFEKPFDLFDKEENENTAKQRFSFDMRV